MIPALKEVDSADPYDVHKAMFFRDAPRPYIAAGMLQRLRPPYPGEGLAKDRLHEAHDP